MQPSLLPTQPESSNPPKKIRTLLSFLDRFPPCLCRLLARDKLGFHSLSHEAISKASGLSVTTIVRLSRRHTWKGLRVETVQAFALACGVDHFKTKRAAEFLRKRKMVYVRNANGNKRRLYARIMQGA